MASAASAPKRNIQTKATVPVASTRAAVFATTGASLRTRHEPSSHIVGSTSKRDRGLTFPISTALLRDGGAPDFRALNRYPPTLRARLLAVWRRVKAMKTETLASHPSKGPTHARLHYIRQRAAWLSVQHEPRKPFVVGPSRNRSHTIRRADSGPVCPTSESGSEATSLASLLKNNSTVSLSCSTPTTIAFTAPIELQSGETRTIDASSSPKPITFDGGNTSTQIGIQIFLVDNGASLTLNTLTLQNGLAVNNAGGGGGTIRWE
jgi:hypothetical protein